MRPLGLYIHIPFCKRKCNYCDFYSVTELSLCEGYTRALCESLSGFANECQAYTVDSVFIGGGTPPVIGKDNIGRILDSLRQNYTLSENAEISIEANPESVSREDIFAFASFGVNRLSLGLQSSCEAIQKSLGRRHTSNDFVRAVQNARDAGILHLNADLMYGLPGQTPRDFFDTVEFACDTPIDHVSAYLLKIEAGTPFASMANSPSLPNEDAECEMYLRGAEILQKHGFLQYEISNFAKEGAECRHNIKYWTRGEYLGFGPAAHSFFGGERFFLARDINGFCKKPPKDLSDVKNRSRIDTKEAEDEYIMLALRLCRGIDKEDYKAHFGEDFDQKYLSSIRPFLRTGHVERTERGYRLSPIGFLISNYIISDILEK